MSEQSPATKLTEEQKDEITQAWATAAERQASTHRLKFLEPGRIEGVPEGYRLVKIAKATKGDHYVFLENNVRTWLCGSPSTVPYAIVERVEPEKELHLIVDLTPETQRIVERPEKFWITSMGEHSFSQFRVEVREKGAAHE